MNALVWIMLGCVLGGTISALVARVAVKRSSARARISQQRARSAERLAEIGSMTSGLAHEIKNPLSTVGLNAQLLGESISDLPEDAPISPQEKGRMGRRVTALRAETDRLRGILEDFLEYAGELRLDTQRVDLNTIIEQLGDFFHVQAQTSGVQIRLDPSSRPAEVMIDADHIKQALLNLMINAVNAMQGSEGQGNELILRVVMDANLESPRALIHVIDTGPGISLEDQDKIFHPYFTTRASGTGLGLPTARRIAEAHGGSLELHSEPGKGSDFAIVLPLDPPAQIQPSK
ncbi:MAG: nitrogen regulation protein NR(II) [Phycisphaerales bacterium]